MDDGRSPKAALKRERVRAHLLALVEERRPGDAIPSERTLSTELGVSRPTLRAAVDELVATGRLVREHGRGMFVAPAKVTQELVAESHPAAPQPAPGAWTSQVLEFRTVTAGARIGRRLKVSPAAELVHVARLRFVDGAPIALEYLHIPAELVPSLTPEQLEAGFYLHLREERKVVIAQAVQSIEPTVLSEDEAGLLGVPVLSPLCCSTASPATAPAGPWSTCGPCTAATGTASSPGWRSGPPPTTVPPPTPRAPRPGGARWSERTERSAAHMTNHTYRVTEIVGTSPDGIDQAIRNGISRANQTLRGLDWFEMTEVRGQIVDGQIQHWQVGIKVGFRLEEG